MNVEENGIPQESISRRERLAQFARLRRQTLKKMKHSFNRRILENPTPTELEIVMQAFIEQLEPQVRDAVVTLNEKGYKTISSGFSGTGGQVIEGSFVFDGETKERLKNLGIIIKESGDHHYTGIVFYPDNPDLSEIKVKWDQIADVVKPTGKPVRFSYEEVFENEFLEQYSNPVTVRRIVLERRLANENLSPEEKSQLEEELRDLRQREGRKRFF